MDTTIPQDTYDTLFQLLTTFWKCEEHTAADRLKAWMVVALNQVTYGQAGTIVSDFADQGVEHQETVVAALCTILLE
jgi:hypothetical protein